MPGSRDWESLGGGRGGSELALKRTHWLSGGRRDPGAAVSSAPLPYRGCLPCCQSNWRARLRSRIPKLSRPSNRLQRTSLTSEPWQPMWWRYYRATGRGRGEGQGLRKGRGSCRGPARALPHARAHCPSLRRTRRNPLPPPPRRLRLEPALTAHRPSTPGECLLGSAGLGPSASPDSDV